MSCAEITVLEALAARLADIRTSASYETDLGARVYDTEPEPEEAPKGPFVVIGGLTSEFLVGEAPDWTMRVDLDVYVDGQEMDYRGARDRALDALRDIVRALRGNSAWGSTLMHARVEQKTLPRRVPGSRYLIATAGVEIDYLDED